MDTLGTIHHLNARDVWQNEATDFTPWLGDNLEHLGEALGLDLELTEMEAPVGGFSLDLLSKDLGSGRTVVIENQLTPTDHDHLGKLLTYASGYDASVVVWVATEIREEHRQALDWLNSRTDSDADFFGVIVEVIKIDDSPPAVQLRPVAAPNSWRKDKRTQRTPTPSAKGEAYREFFQELIDVMRQKHHFTKARVAQPQNWYSFATGVSGITYAANYGRAGLSAQVYIDVDDETENKRIFDTLHEKKGEFESRFGGPLSWERLDERRASRIAVYCKGAIHDPPERLAQLHEWLVNHLLRLRDVFGANLQEVARG